ncbi:hypothetical protein BJY01DRAFT_239145 [Aspergillus pseudoustus]|uniref:Enoyl reductase (ER) domain-containing protein n=1 Tax=Aspergillus pseudoustus TaxID=1810923 RepID=A0ABR4J6A4_9EURO
MSQKAIVVTAPKKGELVMNHPIPSLRDDYILVKTVSVALNPTDWKHIDYLAPPGLLVGCDYAGIVEAVGKDVKKQFKKGDRVCGFVHGSKDVQPQDGAFAEYIVAKGDIQIRIPDNLSFQEAATLGVGITTVGQSLYQSLELALPESPIKDPVPILIYGGSSATGSLAIQFAKLSGYTVLTTCSPSNFDFVKSLGADTVFDYKDSNSAAEIRKYTNNNLKLVLDTIALESTAAYCDQAISTEGGEYTALLNSSIERENVNDRWTLGYTAVGEAFNYGPTHWPAKPEDKAFAEKFWALAEKLLAEGKVKVHRPSVRPGGLKGVLDGLQLLREDKVLIIGATSGIGRALASKFANNNVPLIIFGRREQNLRDFVNEHAGHKIESKVFDITKLDQIPTFLSEVFTEHPDIDCVFVNPGIQRPFDFSSPETVDLSIFDDELLTNYTSAMALVPMMRCPNYGASKAALHHFILALRTQLKDGPGDVRVIEIFPPAVQTELHDTKHQPDLKDGHLIGMPLDEFIDEVWAQFIKGNDQIAVGSAKEIFDSFEVTRQGLYENITAQLNVLLKQFLR